MEMGTQKLPLHGSWNCYFQRCGVSIFETHTLVNNSLTVTAVIILMMIERMIRQLVQFLPALRGWLGPTSQRDQGTEEHLTHCTITEVDILSIHFLFTCSPAYL